ncbi:MAG: YihY/virulence factor BrkB family protein [Lachnospiraceae bacterium]|nr:YihY/virulence factor BrkB family protein [Lachnospiraceae bacterium]
MKKILKFFTKFGSQMREDNVSIYASSSAFFIFLSLVPAMILLLSIIPYTPIEVSMITRWIELEFPANTGNFLINLINDYYGRSIGVLSLSVIGTFWSAGKGVNALINGFNAIDQNVDRRNPLLVRLVSCIYTLLFLVGVLFILIIVVGGNAITGVLVDLFPRLADVFGHLVDFRSLLSIGFLFILFLLCFSLLPYKKHRFREQLPGALFSSVLWTGFSYLFSFYVDKFNPFSMYGSLTAIIVLLFWLYACMYLVFVGANINKYFHMDE